MTSPSELTDERKSTHGDWVAQSATARRFHAIIAHADDNHHLTAGQREALDMIATKMSRILCGNASEPDHWDDIAGYAFLGKGGHT